MFTIIFNIKPANDKKVGYDKKSEIKQIYICTNRKIPMQD